MPAAASLQLRQETLANLTTVRDWLRYATSAFMRAELSYGHGTVSALDEAAFLVLESLRLPIDKLEPWLDAHLLTIEREHLLDLIERRIATRLPASYLTGSAYIQGHRFLVDERVIIPRSYIGELLCDGTIAGLLDGPSVTSVLDLCTGSGALAILAALAFPAATVVGADISADALAVASSNVASYELGDRLRLVQGDLFEPLGNARFDLILANPPYVARAEFEAFPVEYKAEPAIAHLGGDDGLDVVHRILSSARRHMTEGGLLVVEIGTGREVIEERYPDLPFLWLDTADTEGEVFTLNADDLERTSSE